MQRMRKNYKYFTWANFFTFQEIKSSKILTQLTKTASIIYQAQTLTFYIPATACMNYAHSHHWLKIIMMQIMYDATEITFWHLSLKGSQSQVTCLSSVAHTFRAWGL